MTDHTQAVHTETDTPADPASAAPKTEADIHELTPHFQHLVEAYVQGVGAVKKAVTPIHVDEIASRVAKFYEMVRKVVDWKEDNVMRRSAIERALKRTLFPKLTGVTLETNIDTYRVAYSI